MDVFLDLSLLGYGMLIWTSYQFVTLIEGTKWQKMPGILFFVMSYVPWFVWWFTPLRHWLVTVGFLLILSILSARNRSGIRALAFTGSFLIFTNLIVMLTSDVLITSSLLFILKPTAILSYLGAFVMSQILRYLQYLWRNRMRTVSYVREVELTRNMRTIKLKGYYDTGNSLLVRSSPVIFLKSSDIADGTASEKIETIMGSTSIGNLEAGILRIKEKKGVRDYRVLVAKVGMNLDFHGCDCLLNVWLR